jgi:pyruvate kinase
MIRAGVDVVRLNFSHGRRRTTSTARAGARGRAARAGKEWPSWPTCRARRSASASSGREDDAEAGAEFVLDAARTGSAQRRVGLDYKELPRDVKPATRCCSTTAAEADVDAVRGEEVHTAS